VSVLPNKGKRTHASVNVTLASHIGLAKLVNDTGVVLPVKQCRQRL
jgi:hypothetical protein